MMRRREFLKNLSGLGLCGLYPLAGSAASEDIFRAGLVLGPGPPGRCDDLRVGGPVVRWVPAKQRWQMWYYCRSSEFPKDIAPAFGSGSIATALSTDGFRWERIDGPLEAGAVFTPSDDDAAFDATHVATGDIIPYEGEWLMVYFAGNYEMPSDTDPMFRAKGYLMRIGIARSRDGINWVRDPGDAAGDAILDVPQGNVYTAFPGLIHDGSRLLLYYSTVDKQARYWRQGISASDDGRHWRPLGHIRWEQDPALFEAGGIITRDVVRNPFAGDPPWLMVYTAKDGRAESGARRSIGAAVSEDAVTWRRLFHHPVFTVGRRGAWDHGGVAVPRLVVTDEDVRLYYYGWSDETFEGPPQRGIGCAIAPRDAPWRFKRLGYPVSL